VSTDEDTPLAITLTGSDVDGDPLSFDITGGPAHGSLTGTAPDLTYTPNADYRGNDSFTFTVSDGVAAPAVGVISINVKAVTGNGFAEWLAESGISNKAPDTDSDNDGIPNAVEYVIGGNPVNQNDNALLPAAVLVEADPDGDSQASRYLRFTYRRTDRSANDPAVAIHVDWTTDLAGPWTTADETHGEVIVELDDETEVGVDLINVYFPMPPAGKLFARLDVMSNLP
jgi:hypothetical protein